MYLTEEEARKKWCPQVRYAGGEDDNNASNRWDGWRINQEICNCIVSDCIMWRWIDYPEWSEFEDGQKYHGYCGLGGRP